MTRPGRGARAGVVRLLVLLLLAYAPVEARAEAGAGCPLCRLPADAELVVLSEGDLVATATALAEESAVRIAHIDSRLRRGAFGEPGSRQARARAHLLARVSLPNLYHYLFRFANDPQRVHESGPAPFVRLAAEFVEPLLFPVARVRRVRLGRGRGCVQYDLEKTVAGEMNMGGTVRRFRVTDATIEGRKRRVLAIAYESASAGSAEILFAAHYSFAVAHVRDPGPPAPYDLFVVRSLDGMWIRHHGVHRPEAFVYWVSSLDPGSAPAPSTALAGVRIYFPGLRFALPSFLPDIDLEDLRTLGLPMPLLSASYLSRHGQPSWLEAGEALGFEDWVGVGALPAGVRERFPNNARPPLRISRALSQSRAESVPKSIE